MQLLRGLPSNAQKVDKGVTMDLFQNSYGAYLQDDFRVTDRLTLNLGLRYEYNVPVTEGKNELSVADLTAESANCTPKPGCLFIPAGTRGIPDATYFGDRNNFAPRVGFAWRPTDSENFVIRSGFGIYYDQTLLNAHLNARLNPPFRITQLIVNPGTATINSIFNEAPSQTPPGGSYMNLNYIDPSQHQWNVGTQFAPSSQSVIDVAYVGSRGKDLSRFHRINQPAPGQATPFPQFQPTLQEIDNTAESKYDALQLKFEKPPCARPEHGDVLHVVAMPRQRDVLRLEHVGRHGGAGSTQLRRRVGRCASTTPTTDSSRTSYTVCRSASAAST